MESLGNGMESHGKDAAAEIGNGLKSHGKDAAAEIGWYFFLSTVVICFTIYMMMKGNDKATPEDKASKVITYSLNHSGKISLDQDKAVARSLGLPPLSASRSQSEGTNDD